MKYKKLKMTHEEIFEQVERHELVICHLKKEDGTLEPFLVSYDNKRYVMPEGYMEYDKKHFRRFFNI
jgi:hypothetical protein